jgi:hypothetical protein
MTKGRMDPPLVLVGYDWDRNPSTFSCFQTVLPEPIKKTRLTFSRLKRKSELRAYNFLRSRSTSSVCRRSRRLLPTGHSFYEPHHQDLLSSPLPLQCFIGKHSRLAIQPLPLSFNLCRRSRLPACKPYTPLNIAVSTWSAPPD